MIPKTIHYCWFGHQPKSQIFKDCFQSWNTHLPDYEIIEWNENNITLDTAFAKQAYADKKWAFVADYIRLKVLYEKGGIYLDTDMLLLKSLNHLLDNHLFLGVEKREVINAAILGATNAHTFLKLCLTYYENLDFYPQRLQGIPFILSEILRLHYNFSTCEVPLLLKDDIKIYPLSYFYPLPLAKAGQDYKKYIVAESVAVHLWEGSWLTEWNHFRMGHLSKAVEKIRETLAKKNITVAYVLKLFIYILLLPIWLLKAFISRMN
jgi:hypothetical protein